MKKQEETLTKKEKDWFTRNRKRQV